MSEHNVVANAQAAWQEFLRAMAAMMEEGEHPSELALNFELQNELHAIIFARILMDQLPLDKFRGFNKVFFLRAGDEMGPDFAESLVSVAHFIRRTV